MKKSTIFLLTLFILIFFSLFESFQIFPIDDLGINFPCILRMAILLLNISILNILFYVGCIKSADLKEWTKGLLTGVYSIFMVFYLLEIFFIFYPKSHSSGNVALSNISWSFYYNKPPNEYNFRGNPIGDLTGKKKIYVIGDSFTAGWGIKNVNNRFPEILEKKIGHPYRVINMGVGGFNTRQEVYVLNRFINDYGLDRPELVIWQYFLNDMDGIGLQPKEVINAYARWPSLVEYFIKNSFFLNFLYWSSPQKYSQDVVGYYKKNYFEDQEKLSLHLMDILTFVRICKAKNIPLIVVAFPFLNELKGTCPMVESLREIFEKVDVEFINACEYVKDLPLKKRIVNLNDAHPSVLVHQLTAQRLYDVIKEKKLLGDKP